MTFDVNEYYMVSVFPAKKVGPRKWHAVAKTYRRDTNQQVGDDFLGEGATQNSARERAGDNAEIYAKILGAPKDWKKIGS